jgi:hypothetical protein
VNIVTDPKFLGTAGTLESPVMHFVEVVKREFFIDTLLVRIHLIIEMISVDRASAMGV